MFSIVWPFLVILRIVTLVNKNLFYACFSLLSSFVLFSAILSFWGETILSFTYLIIYVSAIGIMFTFSVLVITRRKLGSNGYLEMDIHLTIFFIGISCFYSYSSDSDLNSTYSIMYRIWITPEIWIGRDLLLYEWLYSTPQMIFTIVLLIICALYCRMLVTETNNM